MADLVCGRVRWHRARGWRGERLALLVAVKVGGVVPQTVHGVPYAPGSDTSYEAALRASAFVCQQGLRVYRWVRAQGPHGATQKEAETALGITRQSLCARFKALEDVDAVQKTARRRGGCGVYVVTQAPPVQLGLLDL